LILTTDATVSILSDTIMTNAEIESYDLSTTGTVVELQNTSSDEVYGFTVDATAPVDYVIEIRGGTVGYTIVDDFAAVTSIFEGFEGPEVVDIRIRNTSTASGTADAILGSGGR
jgi:hypothetical protein